MSPARPPRRGAGVVERGGLENRCPFTGTQGSNPCLSAIFPWPLSANPIGGRGISRSRYAGEAPAPGPRDPAVPATARRSRKSSALRPSHGRQTRDAAQALAHQAEHQGPASQQPRPPRVNCRARIDRRAGISRSSSRSARGLSGHETRTRRHRCNWRAPRGPIRPVRPRFRPGKAPRSAPKSSAWPICGRRRIAPPSPAAPRQGADLSNPFPIAGSRTRSHSSPRGSRAPARRSTAAAANPGRAPRTGGISRSSSPPPRWPP